MIEKTVIFDFSSAELSDLVESCKEDEMLFIIERHVSSGIKLLEAGAGSGKWVIFLDSIGYDVTGIEINQRNVSRLKGYYPEIKIDCGDITSLPYENDSFDSYLSFGVLEHLIDGPEIALSEAHRVLKENGVAIISVPLSNFLWSIEKYYIDRFYYSILSSNIVRKVLGRKPTSYTKYAQYEYNKQLHKRVNREVDYKLRFHPKSGIRFYEYRYKKTQLVDILENNGFEIAKPIYYGYSKDRLYQIFGKIVGKYAPGKPVTLNKFGDFIDKLIPEAHGAHMLILVAHKI